MSDSPFKATFYVLDAHHNVVPAKDVRDWATWFESARLLGDDEPVPGVRVATIFDGLICPPGKRPRFTTAVFVQGVMQEETPTNTYETAMVIHKEAVARCLRAGNSIGKPEK